MKMKTVIFLWIIMISLFQTALIAQAPVWSWAKSVGSIGDDYPKSIVTDENGNIYCIGDFENTVDFDPGPGVSNLSADNVTDIFISKWDSAGNFIWVKKIGGDSHDHALGFEIDPAGYLIATGTYADTVDFDPGIGVFNMSPIQSPIATFMLKLDTAGNFIWVKQINVYHSQISNKPLVVYPDGSFCISGMLPVIGIDMDPDAGIALLSSNGGTDMFLAKYTSSGAYEWAINMGGNLNYELTHDISMDPTIPGAVYFSGEFQNTLDFDPGANVYNLTSSGDFDIFIASYSTTGTLLWAKSFGGVGWDRVNSMHTDTLSGDIYITGSFSGTVDVDPDPAVTYNLVSNSLFSDAFILKLDPTGNFIWAKSFGGISTDEGLVVAVDPAGSVFVAGFFMGTADFDPSAASFTDTSTGGHDLYISKFDSNGNFIWVKTAEGLSYEMIVTIDFDPAYNIYVGGSFDGPSILLAPFSFMNAGPIYERDLFIAKIPDVSTGLPSSNDEASYSLYPNPASDFTTLYFSESNRNNRVHICDLNGKIIKEINSEFQDHIKLNITELESGVYFVRIACKENILVKKLIVLN